MENIQIFENKGTWYLIYSFVFFLKELICIWKWNKPIFWEEILDLFVKNRESLKMNMPANVMKIKVHISVENYQVLAWNRWDIVYCKR